MEYSPPPLFKQGASARAKVVFFSFIAIALLVADSRMRSLTLLRQVFATSLYPLQMAALVPRDLVDSANNYFTSLATSEKENASLRHQQTVNAQMLQRAQLLLAENNQLRKLLGTSEQLTAPSLMSEILFDARDTGSRKVVVNRGLQHGVALGQPVIDDTGVVGQVTRVFPFTSEVTLLTDKDQAIPVQVVRSGLRSVAYGRGRSGVLDLRFMAANADIQVGDVLVTSGIDGVYPPGLAVAKVVQVDNTSSDAFAQILCQPAAGIDRNRQLLILLAETDIPQRPESEDDRDKKDKLGRKRTRDLFRDGAKEPQRAAPASPTEAAEVAPDVLRDKPKQPAQEAAMPKEAPRPVTDQTKTAPAAPPPQKKASAP